ncbi:conserved hypothetical protein [Xanthomonas oryzae pv. oryzae MAFF 311018]|nr:conserved hypothetical protein [Xanthomonas oryzae pv. oryzae MAFF 311018]
MTVTGLTRGLPPAHLNSRVVASDPSNRYGKGTTSYWYNDLKQAYGYPSYQTMIGAPGQQHRLDGSGSTIAVLINSDVLDSDIATMFDHEHFSLYAGNHANPTLYARHYVAGAKPGLHEGNEAASIEATLDVDMALGGAPGAHVLLYVVPDLSSIPCWPATDRSCRTMKRTWSALRLGSARSTSPRPITAAEMPPPLLACSMPSSSKATRKASPSSPPAATTPAWSARTRSTW